MRYGIVLPVDDPRQAVELAARADDAGWDAIFVAEVVYGMDAWVTLGACASATDRIRLGTMLTPPSRRRPWKLASEVLTLDHVSNGRAILSVGLGALDVGFANVGEVTDKRERAELLDESLDIIMKLWSGKAVEHRGRHYTVSPLEFPAPSPPVQKPRIPIWCVGAWGRRRSMERALRCDGLIPNIIRPEGTSGPAEPADIRPITEFIRERKGHTGYDLIVEGVSSSDRGEAAATVAQWADAGATWWVESDWFSFNSKEGLSNLWARVEAGPPSVQ